MSRSTKSGSCRKGTVEEGLGFAGDSSANLKINPLSVTIDDVQIVLRWLAYQADREC